MNASYIASACLKFGEIIHLKNQALEAIESIHSGMTDPQVALTKVSSMHDIEGPLRVSTKLYVICWIVVLHSSFEYSGSKRHQEKRTISYAN